MQSRRILTILSALIFGVLGMMTAVSAATSESPYDELARLNPGTTGSEMRHEVAKEAETTGLTADEIVMSALAEARANAGYSALVSQSAAPKSSSSGGDKSARLPNATTGDIFWWDSTTDHVGLYSTAQEIVQAPGRGKVVQILRAGSVQAPRKTTLMFVNTKDDGSTRISSTARNKAASWAKSKKGKPYNSNFPFNKSINASKYNCSQLVWAAWKATSSIDLDNGLSKGVYPGDIRADRRTHSYRTSI